MPYRVPHSKSRHGCTQCRAKKVRCDQRKPGCRRCEASGISCPGYILNLRWSPKNQLHQNSPSSSRPKPPILSTRQALVPQNTLADGTLSAVRHIAAQQPEPSDQNLLPGHFRIIEESPFSNHTQLGVGHYLGYGAEVPLPQWPVLGFLPPECVTALEADMAWGEPSSYTAAHYLPPGEAILEDDWQDMQGENNDGSPNSHPSPGRLQTGTTWDGDNMPALVAPTSTLPRHIENLPTALSDFFIKEVIPLYCAWDSKLNFMRVLVENTWQSSEVLYHTMQSMAAACLASSIPELSSIAAQERAQALQCLDADSPARTSNQEARLLANLLLGHTASWHDPRNLAKEGFKLTQKLVHEWMATDEAKDAKPMTRFFQTAVDYWAMLLSYFMDTSCTTDQSYGSPFIGPEEPVDQFLPHPFAGISEQTVKTLTDIGRLVFQYRKRTSSTKFVTERDLGFFKNQIREARCLEKRLLAYKPADTSKFQDIGDPNTKLGHLSKIDEAYRCVGLLQIYRVFPDLLAERYTPWDNSDIFCARPPSKTPSKEERDSWLTNLALHTLHLLREIPFESRTRSIQPLIIVAASNELRRGHQDVASLGSADEKARELGHNAIELVRARSFVKARLSAYADVLPLRKIINILELVTNIWGALDAGEPEVYWLDVCNQKQLGTLMG